MSSWGLGNIIFKITIFTWLFKYLVPKVNLMGRSRKVSFDVLQTFFAFRTYKYIYIYIYTYTCIQNKNCHQHSYAFENLMSSWGLRNNIFKITLFTWVFKILVPKIDGYQFQIDVKLGVGVKTFKFTAGWWLFVLGCKSSFSGKVGDIKFKFWLVVLIFD